jgi:hypothetical protein
MSKYIANKPSQSVDNLLPTLDTQSFSDFLKAYYEWMESTKLTVTGVVGTFTVGETIKSSLTGVSAQVKQVNDTYLILKIFDQETFEIGETITGQSSGATSSVVKIEDQALRKASNLVQNKTFEYASGEYFEYLKAELNRGIPAQTETERRMIAKKIGQFYSSKSTEDAYRFFFKNVYDDDVIFRYPGEEILRVSDGRYEKQSILRGKTTYDSEPIDVFQFLNKTVRGRTSNAVANIVDVRITSLGAFSFGEFTLTLVSGTFLSGEEIFDTSNAALVTELYGVVSGFNINDAGSGYSVGDAVPITSGTGIEASATVSSINSGSIDKITINTTGHGYQVDTEATINNTGTGGDNFALRVTKIKNAYTIGGYNVGEIEKISIINRGSNYNVAPTITLEDTLISAIGALHPELITINGGDDYSVGDTLGIIPASGTPAAAIVASIVPNNDTAEFVFEDDFNLQLEGIDSDSLGYTTGFLLTDDPTADGKGTISRIEFTDFGTGFVLTELPKTFTITSTGTGAVIQATSIQGASASIVVSASETGVGLGSIREIEIDNFGVNYEDATIDMTGSGNANAVIEPIVSGISVSSGQFLTTDSLIGRRVIQDSLFFQDFSYVIRSGLGFNVYRSIIKDTLHPAGTQFFGEILISTFISLTPEFYTTVTPQRATSRIIFLQELLAFMPATPIRSEFVTKFTPTTTIQQLSTPKIPSYNIEIQKNIPVSVNIDYSNIDLSFNTVINTPPTVYYPPAEKKFVQEIEVTVGIVDPLDVTGPLYKDLEISVLASSQISAFKLKTFEDQYTTQRNLYVNVPIAGTITTSGTAVNGIGTDFIGEFSEGEYIIIGDEKFVITDISNQTQLTINVTPTGTYNGVAALREYLL